MPHNDVPLFFTVQEPFHITYLEPPAALLL
jgi:hypothetical protein